MSILCEPLLITVKLCHGYKVIDFNNVVSVRRCGDNDMCTIIEVKNKTSPDKHLFCKEDFQQVMDKVKCSFAKIISNNVFNKVYADEGVNLSMSNYDFDEMQRFVRVHRMSAPESVLEVCDVERF